MARREQSDQQNRVGCSVAIIAILATVGLPILYVLMIGPLSLAFEKGWMTEDLDQFFTHFYEPLRWIYDRSELVQRFVDWYIQLWVG